MNSIIKNVKVIEMNTLDASVMGVSGLNLYQVELRDWMLETTVAFMFCFFPSSVSTYDSS